MPIPVAALPTRGYAAGLLLGLRVRIPPAGWIPVSCEGCVLSGRRSLRRADHSSRGVLPTVVRRCVCEQGTFKNEVVMARVGPHRHRK